MAALLRSTLLHSLSTGRPHRKPKLIGALLAVASLLVACSNQTARPVAQRISAAPATPATPTPSAPPSTTQSPPAVGNDPFVLARRYESRDPFELTQRLVEVEQTIRDGKPVTAQDARLQQAAYRQLVRTPEWREQAYRLMPQWLTPIAKANVEAGQELRRLTAPRDALPPWHIVAPPSSDELLAHYRAAEAEFGVGWSFLAAIHLVETRMGRIRGDSIAGAKGPMQFLPATWRAYGEGDINDPRDAIRAAARYLRANGGPSNMARALYAYNHSDHYVRAIELYAARMREHPAAFSAYHGWEVYYRTTKGDALLPVGWTL